MLGVKEKNSGLSTAADYTGATEDPILHSLLTTELPGSSQAIRGLIFGTWGILRFR